MELNRAGREQKRGRQGCEHGRQRRRGRARRDGAVLEEAGFEGGGEGTWWLLKKKKEKRRK